MSDTTFDPSVASGEIAMRGARALELNEVALNGDGHAKEVSPGKFERAGGFFRKRIWIGNPKNQKPEDVKLGESISVVFLKIRRKLVERGADGEIVRSTGEHNSYKDSVVLFDKPTDAKIPAVAEDLRKTYPKLRTVQVVYALLAATGQPELVRLIVKGASLGSKDKDNGIPSFYDYISSFTGDEHFYQYKTILSPILIKDKQDYYVMKFESGERLSEASYAKAMEQMQLVDDNCKTVDKARAERIVSNSVVVPEPAADPLDEAFPDTPAVDINPDDIPF